MQLLQYSPWNLLFLLSANVSSPINTMSRKMLIGMHFGNGYGAQAGAWLHPGVDPKSYTNFDNQVRYAQAAERGKFQFLFVPDFPLLHGNVENEAPGITIDPLMTLAAVARETSRIGLVSTGTTGFQEPYNTARTFKALDIMSHGRAGWNAVSTSDPRIAANYGAQLLGRAQRYERLHESVQVVQALWGSWELEAWKHDRATGIFADPKKIRPINMIGKHVGSIGPLPLPPSEQGQPVIFQAGGGGPGAEVAGRYASGVIGAVQTIEDAVRTRNALRAAAKKAGRDPDEVKFFPGLMTSIAPTKREGLDRRIKLNEYGYSELVGYLGGMLGLRLDPKDIDKPLSEGQLRVAIASPMDPRSANALKIARQGWSMKDILAHGVIDYHPAIVGPAVEAADHMQKWFEAGAADGFWVSPDVCEDGIDAFVDGVVPILQERGLFHLDYEGKTLREHLGAKPQYGIDPRIEKVIP